MRPSRILAIARRDLAQELRGRQGWVLPAVMAGLLVPSSAIPPPPATMVELEPTIVSVTGKVPDAVLRLDDVERRRRANLVFQEDGDTLVVRGSRIREDVRAALDGPEPAVVVEALPTGFTFPGRTLLFALISASTLTGAVSASIGGERSRRTLVVLLSAAVSRSEIVVGKWAAWGGLGALTGCVAAALAVLLGNVEIGWWLVPLPTVPLATVAFGLWLVRRAGDVIAGSTVSLRVLPAVLAVTGMAAWFAGRADPLLGALVPLGGALVAAGDTWSDPRAVFLSAGVTLAFAALCLAGTARDLEEVTGREAPERPGALALVVGALAAVVWWLPLTVPLLWGQAGNPRLTEELPRDAGILAGALGLLLFTGVRLGRAAEPLEELGWKRATPAAAASAVAVGVLLALADPWMGMLGPTDGFLLEAADRLSAAFRPGLVGGGVAVVSILADELLFRGWLARAAGPARAGAVYVLVKAPLDPLGGLLSATLLGGLSHRFGVVAAIAAHAVWWVLGA